MAVPSFLRAIWAPAVMTIDRLLLALGMSLYILLGLAFEERALRREFGPIYAQYAAAVPRLIPFPMKRSEGSSSRRSPIEKEKGAL